MEEIKHVNLSYDVTKQNPLSFVENVKDGEHGCLLYLEEWDKQRILFHFLARSLSDGYYCVYATATQSIDEAKSSMKIHGLEPNNKDSDCLLVVKGEDLYENPDEPNIKKWLASVETTYEKSIKIGKKGLRIAADLSSYFLSRGLLQQWFDLESSLGAKFKNKIAIICAYDAGEAPSRDALSVLNFYKKLQSEEHGALEVHSFALIPVALEEENLVVRFSQSST